MEKKRIDALMQRDQTHPEDRERMAMWTIFGGNPDLYRKIEHLYDFEQHSIRPEAFEGVDLSSGAKALLILAYNLYNGYDDQSADVLRVMAPLDEKNRRLALEAIKIRFGMKSHDEINRREG